MIAQVTINGRPAQAMYMNDRFEPVDDEFLATLVEVTFTDDEGGRMFLVPKSHSDTTVSAVALAAQGEKKKGWAAVRARAERQREEVARGYARRMMKQPGHDVSDQPRDDHGRFSSGGDSGDGAQAKPVSGFKPGLKANKDDKAVRAVKADWFNASPFKEDIEGAIAAAPSAQEQLASAGKTAGEKAGVKFLNPGVKTDLSRIKEKVVQRGGAERVTDLARVGFVIDHPEQAAPIVAELSKHFEIAAEDWNPTSSNYTDKALQVRFSNGLIGEVQIVERNMYDAKFNKGGHDMYKAQQKVDRKTDPEKWQSYEDGMQKLYGDVVNGYDAAWRAALGKGGTSGKAARQSASAIGRALL